MSNREPRLYRPFEDARAHPSDLTPDEAAGVGRGVVPWWIRELSPSDQGDVVSLVNDAQLAVADVLADVYSTLDLYKRMAMRKGKPARAAIARAGVVALKGRLPMLGR